MRMETLQTAEERSGDTVPRAVADRLAEAWEIVLSADQTIEMGQWMDNYADVAKARARKAKALIDARAALADYRKAVARGE